jgi:hypothetical protein
MPKVVYNPSSETITVLPASVTLTISMEEAAYLLAILGQTTTSVLTPLWREMRKIPDLPTLEAAAFLALVRTPL